MSVMVSQQLHLAAGLVDRLLHAGHPALGVRVHLVTGQVHQVAGAAHRVDRRLGRLVGRLLHVGGEAEVGLVGVAGRARGQRADVEALLLQVVEGGVDVLRRDTEDAERVVALRRHRGEHVVLLGLVPAGGLVERDVAETEVGLRLGAGGLPRLEVGVCAAGHQRDLYLRGLHRGRGRIVRVALLRTPGSREHDNERGNPTESNQRSHDRILSLEIVDPIGCFLDVYSVTATVVNP